MRRLLVVLAALIVIGLYFHGSLDREAYKIGLNYTTCAENAFGAVFCGDQLTSYQESLRRLTTPTP